MIAVTVAKQESDGETLSGDLWQASDNAIAMINCWGSCVSGMCACSYW